MSPTCNTPLLIVGAGAAGLFAASLVAEAGGRALLVERRHRPGLKLLMCGNNRCNFGHLGTPQELLRAYGEPVSSFLGEAIRRFPSTEMGRWLEARGVPVKRSGERLYPAREKGEELLHLFTDILREHQFPVLYQCPVQKVLPAGEGGFRVETPAVTLTCRKLILAVGGCSYPQTGSMGDGLLFAEDLGLQSTPPRAGLVGLQLSPQDPLGDAGRQEVELPEVVASAHGVAATSGNLVILQGLLRGSAVYDLTRRLARAGLPFSGITLDLLPGRSIGEACRREEMLRARHGSRQDLILNGMGLPYPLAQALATRWEPVTARLLKEYPLKNCTARPLREAIVTVGGIALEEFNPKTMECRKYPGLYAAGECLDIDGPTGGYNLAAAFATARLAVQNALG